MDRGAWRATVHGVKELDRTDPEFVQVHVHCIRDAVQASHPLMPYSPSTHNLSQYQGLFQQVMFALDDQITGASVLLVTAQG